MMDMNSAVAGTITGACGCNSTSSTYATPMSVDTANDPNAAPAAIQYGETMQGSTYEYGATEYGGVIQDGTADAVEGTVESVEDGN